MLGHPGVGGIFGCSVPRHSGHLSSRGSLEQFWHSLCLGSQLRRVSAGLSKHTGQSSRARPPSSVFHACLWTSSSGWRGGGAASKSGSKALCTSVPMSPGGVVWAACSTAGVVGPGWALCLRLESGRGPSSLGSGRGDCVGIVFGGSSCVVSHP